MATDLIKPVGERNDIDRTSKGEFSPQTDSLRFAIDRADKLYNNRESGGENKQRDDSQQLEEMKGLMQKVANGEMTLEELKEMMDGEKERREEDEILGETEDMEVPDDLEIPSRAIEVDDAIGVKEAQLEDEKDPEKIKGIKSEIRQLRIEKSKAIRSQERGLELDEAYSGDTGLGTDTREQYHDNIEPQKDESRMDELSSQESQMKLTCDRCGSDKFELTVRTFKCSNCEREMDYSHIRVDPPAQEEDRSLYSSNKSNGDDVKNTSNDQSLKREGKVERKAATIRQCLGWESDGPVCPLLDEEHHICKKFNIPIHDVWWTSDYPKGCLDIEKEERDLQYKDTEDEWAAHQKEEFKDKDDRWTELNKENNPLLYASEVAKVITGSQFDRLEKVAFNLNVAYAYMDEKYDMLNDLETNERSSEDDVKIANKKYESSVDDVEEKVLIFKNLCSAVVSPSPLEDERDCILFYEALKEAKNA